LRGVGVGIDDDGGFLNLGCGHVLWGHLMGRPGLGLSAEKTWDGEEQDGGDGWDVHRLGVASIEQKGGDEDQLAGGRACAGSLNAASFSPAR
jgi:hypothetical protein